MYNSCLPLWFDFFPFSLSQQADRETTYMYLET